MGRTGGPETSLSRSESAPAPRPIRSVTTSFYDSPIPPPQPCARAAGGWV